MSFRWNQLYESNGEAIASLIILIICSIISLTYLSTMSFIFCYYIPREKNRLSQQKSQRYSSPALNLPNFSGNTINESTNNNNNNNNNHNNHNHNHNHINEANLRLSITGPSDDYIISSGSPPISGVIRRSSTIDSEFASQSSTNTSQWTSNTNNTATATATATAATAGTTANATPISSHLRNTHNNHRRKHISANSTSISIQITKWTAAAAAAPAVTANTATVETTNADANNSPLSHNSSSERTGDIDSVAANASTGSLTSTTTSPLTNTNTNTTTAMPNNKSHLNIPTVVEEHVESDVETEAAQKSLHVRESTPSDMQRYASNMLFVDDPSVWILISLPDLNFRILLFSAVICSTIFIITTTLFTYLVVFVDDISSNCSIQTGITLVLVIQRILLYTFFIQRLSFSFADSPEYKISKVKLVCCRALMCVTALTPAITAQYFAEFENCNVDKLRNCFIFGVIQDIFWAIFTLSWYIFKLVRLENSLHFNAGKTDKEPRGHRKKKKKKDKRGNNNNNNNRSSKEVASAITRTTTAEEEAEQDEEDGGEEDKMRSLSNASVSSNGVSALNRTNGNDNGNVNADDGPRQLKRSSFSSRMRSSLTNLHRRTNSTILKALQKNLKIKRLVKKLLILTITAITSTFLMSIALIWIPVWTGISIDLIINNACMLLSFKYAENVFQKIYPCCSLY